MKLKSGKLWAGLAALAGGAFLYHRHEHPITAQTIDMGQGFMLNVQPLIAGQKALMWTLGKNGAIVMQGNASSVGDAKMQARAAMPKAVG